MKGDSIGIEQEDTLLNIQTLNFEDEINDENLEEEFKGIGTVFNKISKFQEKVEPKRSPS